MTLNERLEKKAWELGINEEAIERDGLVGVRRVGNLMWVSGSGCDAFRQGQVGRDITQEDGYLACQRIACIQIKIMKNAIGDLNRVDQVLRVYGHVTVADDFHDLDKLADGFSDVFGYVFGEAGVAPRTILGSRNMPVGNTAAEFECIVALKD